MLKFGMQFNRIGNRLQSTLIFVLCNKDLSKIIPSPRVARVVTQRLIQGLSSFFILFPLILDHSTRRPGIRVSNIVFNPTVKMLERHLEIHDILQRQPTFNVGQLAPSTFDLFDGMNVSSLNLVYFFLVDLGFKVGCDNNRVAHLLSI